MSKAKRPEISDQLLDDLLAGNGIRPNIAQRLALDLREARRESERRGKAMLAVRRLLVEFINKHNVPTTANDLVMSETGITNKDGSYTVTERKLHSPLEEPTSPRR